VSDVPFPPGYGICQLHRGLPRKQFQCGRQAVDDWLVTKALQNQEKHLSVTKVLLDVHGRIAGYYTLATGEVDFGDMPAPFVKKLPRRRLPVAVLAWLGVSLDHQGTGLGRRLLSRALRDCYEAGQTFAFVAVVLDCLDDDAKRFYQRWDFQELPGQPYRLYLSTSQLTAMMESNR
jgi:GNAT superfamily N-acetyltransferase